MEKAAQELDAGAFKLWCYFAKNQNGYEFALSSKDAADNFGLKKKQYDNAVKELIEKSYLVVSKGNNYVFNEIPVVSKGNNDVVSKSNNVLYPKDTRNITNTTFNTTKDITLENLTASAVKFSKEKPEAKELGSLDNPIAVKKEWLVDRCNNLTVLTNGLYMYGNKFYKMEDK